MTWTEYHEQDDVESFLDYLANTYDFVEVESIGESYEGRPMRVVKVGQLKYIHYAPLIMSLKESPRNHPWVLPKKVASLV